MNKTVSALLLMTGLTVGATSLAAQERYTMQETENGVIRLDTQTGEVSHCLFENEQLVCRVAADDRTAYEDEIVRLTEENESLRNGPNERSRRPGGDLPSEQEIQEAMSLFETFTTTFLNSIRNLQQDLEEFERETN